MARYKPEARETRGCRLQVGVAVAQFARWRLEIEEQVPIFRDTFLGTKMKPSLPNAIAEASVVNAI